MRCWYFVCLFVLQHEIFKGSKIAQDAFVPIPEHKVTIEP